jgi:hypothetical protein
MTSRSVVAAALVAACGNYSDVDIEFIEAIPTSSQIHLSLPSPSGGQALCATAESDAFTSAQTEGGEINQGIGDMLDLVDLVRTVAPTKRETGERIWGPFADTTHSGFRDMITMQQVDGGYSYDFEIQPDGASDWTPIITGQFNGGTAATGSGEIILHFDNAAALGINKPTDPTQPFDVSYDLGANPQTIDLSLAGAGLQLLAADYSYQLYADGHGEFAFEIIENGDTATWTVDFQASGAGEGTAVFQLASGGSVQIVECWDATACLDYVDDPGNYTKQPGCSPSTSCLIGKASSCPASG